MYANLHMHSTFSDGTDTPLELCALAENNGVKVISITDHDTVSGVNSLSPLSAVKNVRMVPGVELSSMHNRKFVHILGYYIDTYNAKLERFLSRMSDDKTRNTKVNFENALSKGVFNYSWRRVIELNGDQPRISGVHVVKAMALDKYSVPGMGLWEMFNKFFMPVGNAYIETEILSGYDAIDVIKDIGGIPVIAHPKSVEDDALVLDFLNYGAQGLEVFHPIHTQEETEKYLQIAKEKKCLISGGSDWHGKNNGPEVTYFTQTGLEHANYEILSL